MNGESDAIDLGDVARSIRHGWNAVLGFLLFGTAVAAAIIIWAPRKFESSSTLVIRESNRGASILARLGVPGDAGSLLGGSATKSSLETELAIIPSRALLGKIVDSLGLQGRLRNPAQRPATSVMAAMQLPGSFKERKYEFTRGSSDKVYNVRGPSDSATAVAGTPTRLLIGAVTLRGDTALPSHFELSLLDREDAITYVQKHLLVEKVEGEVVRVQYKAGDSITAARVPNTLVGVYLARRKTTDRGTNAKRVDFLTLHADSVSGELAVAEDALRRQQEQSGVLDPVTVGKVAIERASELRGELTNLQIESGAIDLLLTQVQQGTISTRQLAAFPTFIKSPAISGMLGQLGTLEAERQKLLATRTEADPEVIAAEQSIKTAEGQLLPIARSYSSSVAKQRSDMERQLDTLRTAALTLPKNAEAAVRKQRDVIRLGQVFAALQLQLVEARLSEIDEGGDARQLDVAEPPKKPSFPEPVTTMGIGIGGGLVAGLIAALLLSGLGRWARDPAEIERIAGVPAIRFNASAPLLLAGGKDTRTILVLPLDASIPVAAVAHRLADTASARSIRATVLDIASKSPSKANGRTAMTIAAAVPAFDVNATIRRLEQEYDLVIVELPDLTSNATAAALSPDRGVLLVASARRVDRLQLANTLQTLKRLDVPCAGIVLNDGSRDGVVTI
ncbi:MAG: Wzz/FepE/Etk N-terminal domain-containing protein [bacterium]